MPAPEQVVAALPKVELHVHLEGSLRRPVRSQLAARHGQALDGADGAAFGDFDGFIAAFMAGLALLRTPADLVLAIDALAADLAADNVRYAEVTSTAWVHLQRTGMAPQAYAQALEEGRRLAEADHGVILAWVIDIPRGWEAADSGATIAFLESRHCPSSVVALGLGGVEIGFPAGPFASSFERARALGLASLPHGGETGGAAYVRDCVELLRADRIGHGVMSVDDPSVLELLVERGVTLEVCPTSNVLLGVAPDIERHPLGRLRDAGVAVTLATDDPGYFANTLTGELLLAHRHHGYALADLIELQRHAVHCSRADPFTRKRLLAELAGHGST